VLSRIRSSVRKREEPQNAVTHPVLGEMLWSEDDEAWFGGYQGFRFSLAYDGQSAPNEPLIDYALDVMNDPEWLGSSLSRAKEEAVRSSELYYSDEIRSLSLGAIHFYAFRGTPRIIAQLETGREFRCWRIEYGDRQCEGIGFDS
jgi:hypothetical protein